MMREEKRRMKQMAAMVRARKAAIRSLPTEALRAHAAEPDFTPAPLHRHMALHTPVIPGFAEAVRKATARQAPGGQA